LYINPLNDGGGNDGPGGSASGSWYVRLETLSS
jgi:hypothetical protein